jgi:two-component system, chemotaxis family, sensor kinase CheA
MALSPDVLKAVLTEVAEQVAVLQTELVESAMPLEDATTLDHLYRAAHTMKGLAGAVEMRDLHQLANAMELVISQARSGALVVDGQNGVILREASAACAALASGEGATTVDVGGLVMRLEGIESSSAPTRRVLFHTTSAPTYAAPSTRPAEPTET